MGGGGVNVRGNHPLAELLARKLFDIERRPPAEQKRMVNRAIRAAVDWYTKQQPSPAAGEIGE